MSEKGKTSHKGIKEVLITQEQWDAREHRHNQCLHDIRICLGFINESISDYEELEQRQADEESWNLYMDCDKLPNVHHPPEMRTFLAEIRDIEARDVDNVVRWTLSVNERSILTQDIEAANLTRSALERTFKPNIGKLYDDAIQRILIILDRIEVTLASEIQMVDVPPERAFEIMMMRGEMTQEINILLDKLTYRVVSAPTTYKTSADGLIENYCYHSSKFDIQIWWLIDASIRFQYMEIPVVIAKLDSVEVQVQIPMRVLCDNMTLRCVHTFFDPYSEFAKSYDLVIEKPMTEFNAGILDIEDCLINEWSMQECILQELIAKIEQNAMLYDAAVKELEEKRRATKSREPINLKGMKEPERLPDGKLPDPQKLFIEREQREFDELLENFLSPQQLQLTSDEINLRRYKILGGIFSLDFVNKPKSTEFEKFNITLHDDGRVIYTKYDIKAIIEPEEQASGRSRQTNFDVMEEAAIIKKHNLHLEPNDVSYFFLIFHLPEDLCRFGQPLACQFIDEDIEEEEEPREPSTADSEQPKKKTKKRKLERASDNEPSRNSKLANKSIYKPSLSAVLRESLTRPSIFPGIIVRNFPLSDGPLTARQKDEVQQHCLPRMLSSLKFPIEFVMEKSESAAKKRGNLYLRRLGKNEASTPMEPEYFDYEKQEGPERLYPYFDKRYKIIYNEESGDEDSPMPIDYHGETLYSMLHTLQDIQGKYQNRSTVFLEQQVYNPKLGILDANSQKSSIQSAYSRQGQSNRTAITSQKTQDSKDVRSSKESKIVRAPDTELTRDSIILDQSRLSTEPEQQTLPDMPRRSTNEIYDNLVNEEPPQKKFVHVKHWTTKYIKQMEFDSEKLTVTIKTDRLGLFGFAYNRYAHFPFQDWRLQQNEENPNEIIFTLDTFLARVILFITNAGIRGYVTKLSKGHVARPVKYLDIEEPISDYRELRRRFADVNMNIFAEIDASHYIENGYFSEKHLSAELHVYDAFAVHCKLLRFYRSDWNRLAKRRDILFCLRNPKDIMEGSDVTIRVTPENSTFVEVFEPCSEDLSVVNLEYTLTWRNIGNFSDVHQLINSMCPQATDVRNRDPKLIYYIRKLFAEVRPLSFS